jgi:hypothetical protein
MKPETYFNLKHLILSNQVKATYGGFEFSFAKLNDVYGINLYYPIETVFVAVENLKSEDFEAWKLWVVR